jgi:hypothetical protein
MTISAEGTKNADGSLNASSVAGGQLRVPFPGGGHKVPGGNKAPGGKATPGGPTGSSLPGA